MTGTGITNSNENCIVTNVFDKYRATVSLGRSNSHLYHYAGNNPVRYVDPEGWFDVDDELKTIAADLDDKQDMSAAARAFFILQNYGYICMAKESNQGQSITFTNARSMYSFLDGTYEEYLNEANFNFDDFFLDVIGLATSDSPSKSFSGRLNIGLTTLSVGSDAYKTVQNLSDGNKLGAINSSADLIIDAIGYAGTAGACISIELKYTKKGVIFGIVQMARAKIELDRYFINNFTKTLFGVTVK